jgi:hypothetical protein
MYETSHEDFTRLKHRLEASYKAVEEAENDYSRTQLDSSKERTQFFEKLAIGSGAAIAAVVSFLGVHAERLKPHWMLQSSLILLVIAMLASLYRNLRYPYYVLAVKNLSWIHAKFHQQQCKKELLRVAPEAVDWKTGEPIDPETWIAKANEADESLKPEIEKRDVRQKRLFQEVRIVENICLWSIALAMVSLVWLALRSF